MAVSPEVARFHYLCCVDRINKYKEGGESEDALLVLASWLQQFRAKGCVTDAQLKELSSMLGIEVEVPDAPDTYEDELAAIRADVSDQGEAVAELSGVVSEQVEALQVTDDAVAELSEIVSGLVPEE